MSGRRSISDYPEHLNPFNKPPSLKRSFRNSFRGLRKKLVEPFRKQQASPDKQSGSVSSIPQSEPIQLRNNIVTSNRSQTLHPTSNGTPTLFPRSRFTERVNQAKTFNGSVSSITSKNPFDEEDDEIIKTKSTPVVQSIQRSTITSEVAVDNKNTIIKKYRRKKRAPLPPNGHDISLSTSELNNSKWSINSYETDCSGYTNNSSDQEIVPGNAELQDLKDVSFEIQKYYNNPAMPDLVISTENDATCDGDDAVGNNKTKQNTTEDTNNENVERFEELKLDNDKKSQQNINFEELVKQHEEIETTVDNCNELNNNDVQCSSLESNSNLHFIETASIYIASSKDNLLFNERKSIYVNDLQDELDGKISKMIDDDDDDILEESVPVPVPKIRKHKLTKEEALACSQHAID